MRPILVEFQAFGPYKGFESIDFEKLSKDGLFLICGETGSGKTMILDAISFALFGKSSGANRDDLFELRCNRADSKDDTFVRFKFEEKGNIYIFERRFVFKKTKFSKEQNALKLNSEGIFVPLFENCKEKDMTAKAEEIIGLNYEQFRQVILLPQGKFEKLLTSSSSEKEEILVNIFGAEKWQGIAEKYFERAKARKDELDEILKNHNQILQEEDCKTIEDLKLKIESIKTDIYKREKEHDNENVAQKKKALFEQKSLAVEFNTLHDFESKIDELNKKAKKIEEDKSVLETAEAAELIREPLEKLDKAEAEKIKRDENLSNAIENLDDTEKVVKDLESELKEHRKKETEYKENLTKKAELEIKKPIYASFDDLINTETEAKQKLSSSLKDEQALSTKKDNCINENESAYSKYNEALSHSKALRDSYMQGIVGSLAKDLSEGHPCPVCGSTMHPSKAQLIEGTATKAAIEDAEKEEENLKEAWQLADKKRTDAELKLKEKQAELTELKLKFETAKASRETAAKNLIKGINNLDELNEKAEAIAFAIKQYEDEEKELKNQSEKAKADFSTAKEKKKNAEAEATAAGKIFDNTLKDFNKILLKSGFETKEVASSMLLDAKIRNELRTSIDSYQASLEQMNKLLKEKRSALKGKSEPALEIIEKKLQELEAKEAEFIKWQSGAEEELKRLSKKLCKLEKSIKEYESKIKFVEDDLIFAKSLRGDTGIGLQRYVLGIMFSSVIGAANEMLSKVHNGRYQLFRTNEKTGDSKKRGLDLKVRDSYGGGAEGRSVSTLSGGEKFLASLALSIGMSTVAKTGGVDIEGIFIDEGFGSLDNDSIDDALSILASIQKAKGMVGIISHVDVLRANIPTQLKVVKTRDTSTIKIV